MVCLDHIYEICLFFFAAVLSTDVTCVAPSTPIKVQDKHIKCIQPEDLDVDILLRWIPNHKPQAILINEFQDPHIQVILFQISSIMHWPSNY